MSCAKEHAIGAFVVVGVSHALVEAASGKQTAAPLLTGGLGALMGSLPDLVEPARHPHHRQFFHGLVFAGVVGYGLYKLYAWRTEDPWAQLARIVVLVAGVAYLSHLAMDACTKRSIPLIGKLGG